MLKETKCFVTTVAIVVWKAVRLAFARESYCSIVVVIRSLKVSGLESKMNNCSESSLFEWSEGYLFNILACLIAMTWNS